MKEITQTKAAHDLRILYPIWMLTAIFSLMYVPSTIVLEGNAEITAQNIATNEFLFRLSIVGSLLTQLLFIIIPLLLYQLFKPLSKSLGILMVVLAFISVPITMYNELHKMTALSLLEDPERMIYFLEMNKQGIIISSIFWGLWLFPLGKLVYVSGYFPKIIGVIIIIAGTGYVVGAFAKILVPDFDILLSFSEILTFGEVLFILWLIIKGVKLKEVK